MEDTRWDHALKVTGGGTGLVGHAGAILLRKAADQAGLTAALSTALRKAGTYIACRTSVWAVAVCYETLVRVPGAALTPVGLRFWVEQVVPA